MTQNKISTISFFFHASLSMILLFFFSPIALNGQREYAYDIKAEESTPLWIIKMYEADPDPGIVMKLYIEYYRNHPFVKNEHTQYYKRWISGLGKIVKPDPVMDAKYLDQYNALKTQRLTANWTPLGPFDWDHDAAGRSYAPGSAHVYTIEQSNSNPDILYAGTANAGIWKSINHGVTWTPCANDLLTWSVTSLEIHPTNPNIVYAELLNSIYKSINGGSTWTPTGSASFQNIQMAVREIKCKPDEPAIVFAGTDEGLYRSTNSGSTWTLILGGDVQEIEFHPTRRDTMYLVRFVNDLKTEFFRSFNSGATFTQQTGGWPNPVAAGEHQKRAEIAVTPDAPDNVYALTTGAANGGSGLYGVYRSTDLGSNWTFRCCGTGPGGPPTPTNMNLMGWSDQGLDDGGQYYYDLAFGVSPYNKDSMWVCGVNLWVSGNEGSSFVCPSAWSHPHKPSYVHADIHEFTYTSSTGEIWVSGDGGIFYSDDSGANFQRHNVGILGSDFWGFGQGYWNGNVMVGGAYHNGTLLKEDNVYQNGWLCTDGGDGVGGYVNPGYDRQVYTWFNIKDMQSNRTINPETREYYNQPNSTYITGMSSDLLFHPHYYGTWYSGSGTKLFRTTDNGYCFEEVYDFGVNVAAMDLSVSDPNVIYVCTFPDWWATKRIYRSMDAGITWMEVTPLLSMLNNADDWVPYDIAVSPDDPLKVWIVRTSMYGDYPGMNGFTVYSSLNGGASWTNISGSGLNGQWPSSMIHQRGTDGGIYIGTRKAVYYRNATMGDWALYNTGLPARIHSAKLATWYRMGKVRNATDRSVWESDFYEPSEPIAIPAVQKQFFFCDRDTAYFTDLSVLRESGNTWSWSFPGGIPSTSNIRNPKVVYPLPGTYDVSLTVSDVNGTSSRTIENMITVDNQCLVDTVPGGALKLLAYPDYVKIEDLNLTTTTITITAWVKPSGIQDDYTSIFMNDNNAAGFNFKESNNTLAYHWPGGEWWWDSNLIVPPDQWSYVAMVVQPGSVTLYVNGYSATHNIAVQSVQFDNVRIGSYQGWEGRNFKGEIDEVCIWNRALTQDEIRLQRHLIKKPSADPGIKAYYQFDEGINSGFIIDKVAGRDGVLNGSAAIITSNVPVGSGTSQILNINSSGIYSFNNGGDLDIGFGTTHPNGKVVVSHLWVKPDVLPYGPTTQGGHWIINNYGGNQSFSALQSMSFKKCGAISNEMAATYNFDLFKRTSNATGNVWTEVSVNSTSATAGLNGILNLTALPGTTSFSQFIFMRDFPSSGFPDVAITTSAEPNPHPPGGASASLLINTNRQAIVLPVLNVSSLNSLGTPVAGQMAFLTDSTTLIYFNGNKWIQLASEPILQEDAATAPPEYVTVSMPTATVNPAYMLNLGQGLLKLPTFTTNDIVTINQLAPGMLIYDVTTNMPRLYNGSNWQPLTGKQTALTVSGSSQPPVPGFAINQNFKHPASVLEISSIGNKAFLLPVAKPENIYSPVAGLICFNPDILGLMLYDGVRWRVMK